MGVELGDQRVDALGLCGVPDRESEDGRVARRPRSDRGDEGGCREPPDLTAQLPADAQRGEQHDVDAAGAERVRDLRVEVDADGPVGDADVDGEAAQARIEKEEARRELQAALERILEVRETTRGLILNVPNVLFDLDRATLKPEGREKLAEVATILGLARGYRLSFEGLPGGVSCRALTLEAEVPAAWCQRPAVWIEGRSQAAELVRPRRVRLTVDAVDGMELTFRGL